MGIVVFLGFCRPVRSTKWLAKWETWWQGRIVSWGLCYPSE